MDETEVRKKRGEEIKNFCKKGACNVGALFDHFRAHGREEGRSFGCVNISAAEKAKYGQVACPTDHHVGGCDNRLNVGRQGSRGVTCRPVGGNCACGRPADLDAISSDVAKEKPEAGRRKDCA